MLPMPKSSIPLITPKPPMPILSTTADTAQVTEAIDAAEANTVYMPPMPPTALPMPLITFIPPIHRPCL